VMRAVTFFEQNTRSIFAEGFVKILAHVVPDR
jgi:hypothetical protein